MVTAHNDVKAPKRLVVLARDLAETIVRFSEDVLGQHADFVDYDAALVPEDASARIKIAVQRTPVIMPEELEGRVDGRPQWVQPPFFRCWPGAVAAPGTSFRDLLHRTPIARFGYAVSVAFS